MDGETIIHDLEAIKEDFKNNNGGCYHVCLDYAIDAVKLLYKENDNGTEG